jgi:hypothetical protein
MRSGISVTSPRLALIVAGTGGGGAGAFLGVRSAACADSSIKLAASNEGNSGERKIEAAKSRSL